MNALSLYVTTCRRVFESDPDDTCAWADIYRLLTLLRQALSCTVCSNLLLVPMTSTVSNCQHSVCKGCVGKKMCLKPACPCGKNYSKFSENVQLRVLLQCYKKFCSYLSASTLHRKWDSVNGGTNFNIQAIVTEGSSLNDDFRYGDGARLGGRVPGSRNSNDRTRRTLANGTACLTGKSVKVQKGAEPNATGSESPVETFPRGPEEAGARRGCRCGLATPNPGKLTCCGQRCPCYVAGSGCSRCKCRGCRNPVDKPSEVWGDGLEVAANESVKLDEEEEDEESFDVEVDD